MKVRRFVLWRRRISIGLRCSLDLFRYLFVPGDFYINGELDIVVKFAVDSLLEGDGFESLVRGESR